MRALAVEIRYALRKLWQTPGFTLAAVLALALGIGSNTALFSVIHGVLLSPLPFPEPDRLVAIWEQQPTMDRASISAPDFRDWQSQAKSFESLSAYIHERFVLTGRERPEQLLGVRASPDFFRAIGVQAALGRVFDAQDGSACVAVLSDATFRHAFAADSRTLGATATLNAQSCTIVGVLPPGRQYPANIDIFVNAPRGIPTMVSAEAGDVLTQRGDHYLMAIGRLRPGVTVETARQELAVIGDRLAQAYPETNRGHRGRLAPLQEVLVRQVRATLFALLGAVGFVLCIAIANIASLQLARAATRRHELVTRVALGASRGQLVRQLLVESVVLALVGAGAGLLVAFWGVDLLVALGRRTLPGSAHVGIDTPVLLFCLGLAVVSGLLFGIIPALHSARTTPAEVLHGHSRATPSRGRARRTLVGAEIALALVLLSGAAVLSRSFWAARAVAPGFDPTDRFAVRLTAPTRTLGSPERVAAYYDDLLSHVAAAPGVRSAGVVLNLPLSGSNRNSDFIIEGRPPLGPDERAIVERQVVSPETFAALGIPLVAGRSVEARDRAGTLPVLVVNQAMARRYFAGQDPIGKRISFDTSEPRWQTIVGVVGDVHQSSLSLPPLAEVYEPLAQTPDPALTLVVHGGPGTAAAVRAAVAAFDPEQPVDHLRPVAAWIEESLAQRRLAMLLFGLFAGLALTLVLVGVYGVMSYTVAQRTREIGIRMALGAPAAGVIRLVTGEALRVALWGAAVGIAAALGLARLLGAMVYGVSARDPMSLLGAALAVVAVAVAASGLPAWRGSRVDPMIALRGE